MVEDVGVSAGGLHTLHIDSTSRRPRAEGAGKPIASTRCFSSMLQAWYVVSAWAVMLWTRRARRRTNYSQVGSQELAMISFVVYSRYCSIILDSLLNPVSRLCSSVAAALLC